MPKYENSKDVGKNWICKDCGSDDVQQEAWVNVNTSEVDGFLEHNKAWCCDCSDHVLIGLDNEIYEQQKIEYIESVGGHYGQ